MVEDGFKKDIERIGAEFTRYRNDIRPSIAPAYLAWQHDVMPLIEQLEDHWIFLSLIGDKGVLNGSHRGTLYLASKCSTDVSGIIACLRNGLPVQASTVLRSLWETALSAKYIYQDFDVRMNDFVRYSDFLKYQRYLNRPHSVPENQVEKVKNGIKGIENRFQIKPIDDWYSPSMREEIKVRGLSKKTGINMRTMSTFVGLEDDYSLAYNALSKAAHGASVIDHMFIQNGRFQAGPNYHRETIITTVGLAIYYADMISNVILSRIATEEAVAMKRYSYWRYCNFLDTYHPDAQ